MDYKVGGLDHWDWLIASIIRSMVVYPGLEVEHNYTYRAIVALKQKHFPNHCYISVHHVCVCICTDGLHVCLHVINYVCA